MPEERPSFECRECGKAFTLPAATLAKYPGWTPRVCLSCRDGGKAGGGRRPGASAAATGKARRKKASRGGSRREQNLPLAQVLARYTEGPKDGVFTDGACSRNPGPGGWAAVWVADDEMLAERHGHDPDTTNNRMELQALIAAFEMLPEDAAVTVWSDSNLCVQTLNQWAAGWRRLGWRRKTGPVENLDLVQRAYDLKERHPKVTLRWIRAHDGARWNEVADCLATAYLRDEI